jgi:hypothetical protein
LGSSNQEGRIGIQLSRGEDWDPVIKRGGVYISFSLTAKDITHEISVIETDCVSTVRETTFQFDVNYIFNVSIILCTCPKPGPGFPRSYMLWVFWYSVSSVKMRDSCSFC